MIGARTGYDSRPEPLLDAEQDTEREPADYPSEEPLEPLQPRDIVPSAALGTGLANYTVSYVNGKLTVNPKALTITAGNQSKIYGSTATLGTSAFTTSGRNRRTRPVAPPSWPMAAS